MIKGLCHHSLPVNWSYIMEEVLIECDKLLRFYKKHNYLNNDLRTDGIEVERILRIRHSISIT